MIFGWDIGAIGGILTLPAFVEYASPSEPGGRTYLTSDSDYNITKDNAADLGSKYVQSGMSTYETC
jgi:hypothetical protein